MTKYVSYYTLTAKDPKQLGSKQFSVWDPTVWDPTVPRATDFGSDDALTRTGTLQSGTLQSGTLQFSTLPILDQLTHSPALRKDIWDPITQALFREILIHTINDLFKHV